MGTDPAPGTVAAGRGCLAVPGGALTAAPAEHVGDVVRWARAAGADVVIAHGEALDGWGLPSAATAAELEAVPFIARSVEAGWRVVCDGWRLRLAGPHGGGWTSVVLLPYDKPKRALSGPWSAAVTFSEMVLGLARFEAAIGQPWRDSIGRTAERLILSTHPRARGGTMLDRRPQIPEPAMDGGMEQPYVWRRPLDAAERGSSWLHHYDANAQYLAAWSSVQLGLGEPRPVAEFEDRPGVWRLGRFDKVYLEADPLLPPPYDGQREWVTTPTVVRLAEVLGGLPPIVEGWVWPEQSRFLRAAAERLRDARAALLTDTGPAERLALAGVKSLYAVETGRFNMGARDERSGWHRPDWGNNIRGLARANLHRRLAGYGDRPALSWPPFAIATDGLLITSDEADPVAWAEKIGLPIGPGLGQFKAEGSCELTPARVDELEAASGVGRMFTMVKAWCRP